MLYFLILRPFAFINYPSKMLLRGSYRAFCQSLIKVKNQTLKYQKKFALIRLNVQNFLYFTKIIIFDPKKGK